MRDGRGEATILAPFPSQGAILIAPNVISLTLQLFFQIVQSVSGRQRQRDFPVKRKLPDFSVSQKRQRLLERANLWKHALEAASNHIYGKTGYQCKEEGRVENVGNTEIYHRRGHLFPELLDDLLLADL
jgi:hypothetical protein